MNKPDNLTGIKGSRVKRIIIWTATIIIVLIIISFLATQTRPFKNWLCEFVVAKANDSINGELSITRLDGNLFDNIELSDIAIQLDSDTVVTLSTLYLDYSLFALLGGTIQIDSISIDSLRITLHQRSDSSWNLARLAKTDTAEIEPDDTSADEFDYTLVIDDFQLRNSRVDINALEKSIPSRVDGLNIHLAGQYSSEKQALVMRGFQFHTIDPEFHLNQLSFELANDSFSTTVKDFLLKTSKNSVTASATILPAQFERSTAQIIADPIDLTEFDGFLPDLIGQLQPLMSFYSSLSNDTLNSRLMIRCDDQIIDFANSIGSVNAIVDSTISRPIYYTADLALTSIAMSHWLDNPELDIVLNGTFELNGTGLSVGDARFKIEGDLNDSRIRQHPISSLSFDLSYDTGAVNSEIIADGDFGKIELISNLYDLFETASYNMNLESTNLDLSKLGLWDSLRTDITMNLNAEGENLISDSIKGETRIAVSESMLMGIPVDTVAAFIGFAYNKLHVDTIVLKSPAIAANITGDINADEPGDLYYDLILGDVSYFADLIGARTVGAEGNITGRISGMPTNMNVKTRIDIRDILMDGSFVGAVRGELNAIICASSISANGRITSEGIDANGFTSDSVFADFNYTDDNIDLSVNLHNPDGIHSELQSRITLDSIMTVLIERLSLDYSDVQMSGGSDSMIITMGDDTYTIENFRLASDITTDTSGQIIQIDGFVSLADESGLSAAIRNVGIQPLASMFDLDLDGILSVDIKLSGSAIKPQLDGQLLISNGQYQRYTFNNLAGKMSYDGKKAGFNLLLNPSPRESLQVDGSFPLAVSSDDSAVASYSEIPLDFKIHTDSLSLSVMKAGGYIVEEADGFITCDLGISSTMNNPIIEGEISMRNGVLSMPDYGIDYNDIEAGISFQPNRMTLDSVAILQDNGKLLLSGYVNYDSSLIEGNISSSHIDLVMDEFFAVRHRDYEIQLSTDVYLDGSESDAGFGGTITVDRSSFYLPAFIEQPAADELDMAGLPMLVIATRRDSVIGDENLSIPDSTSSENSGLDFLDKLRGNLIINIPKNTWIKSPDLRLELGGELEIAKDGVDFEPFGNIHVIRGHYDLYGKRFKVLRGIVTFEGGAEYNPRLDVEALYVFRTASREKRNLTLYVSGTAELPVLKFTLDGEELSEGDAVSYILFGRGFDELSQGQKTSVAGSSEDESMTGQLAVSLLAGQLTKALGNKLNLDVLEVKAEGDLKGAAVVVGKYLTPDLFMSYQRGFGSSSDNDLEPEIVTLEYQLARLLFLQLTEGDAKEAGFDFIIKFQRE
ncbi:MAG: AsmA family protein [candidate division Zixibacteria bacterium]|nr:AsmA family protein [candidate division Zixibacteria bacterium]